MPKEEEAISEAGKNVKESQLALAEEKEVESEAGRNVTELEAHSIKFSGHNKGTASYQEWEDNLKIWYHRHQPSDEEDDDEPVDTWEDFRLEMRRLVEEAEKETAANTTSPKRIIHIQPIPTLQLHALRIGVRRLITLTAHKRWNRPKKDSQSNNQGIHSQVHYNFQKGQKSVQGQKEIQNIQKARSQ